MVEPRHPLEAQDAAAGRAAFAAGKSRNDSPHYMRRDVAECQRHYAWIEGWVRAAEAAEQ